MKKSTFIKFESNYHGGTYADYSSKKELELYVRNRDTDGENVITGVTKITFGTARIVNYGRISVIEKDNLIKDLCYGLLANENNRSLFVKNYGNNVDLESFSSSQLKVLVKKYSYFGARNDDPNIRRNNNTKEKELDSKFLYRENGGDLKVNLMPTRAGYRHKAKTYYIVKEVTPQGEEITKKMNKTEFDALGKVAKTNSWSSNRFAQNSSYTQLAEMNVIKNNNSPAETCIFEMKLENILSLKDVSDSSEE